MRKRTVLLPAVCCLLAGAYAIAPAQQRKGQQQEQTAQQCDLKTSHFAVSRAILYLQTASSAQDSVKRQQALEGAQRSLLEAIEQGQSQNPAVWYYLGFYYTLTGDAAGADSSFDKVEAAMPSCQSDIENYRQNAWVRVINQGIDALRGGQYDKAKEYLYLANRVYGKDGTASFYLGTLYASEDNADSALRYFKDAAVLSAGDTAAREVHEKATQNVARIYQVLERWDSAQVYFRKYLELKPDDMESLTNLASAYLASGDTAQAVAIYDSALAKAERMDPMDLFRIGVALFRADRPARAAAAFEAGLRRNPNYRNGLFNLTNAYFSLAQAAQQPDSIKYWADKMLVPARRLAEIDPLNRQVHRLIAAGYQLAGQNDSTDAVLKRVAGMRFEVDVQSGQATNNGYDLRGTITAIQPPEAQAVRDSIARDSSRLETLKASNVPAAQRAQAQRQQARLQANLDRLRSRLQQLMGPVNVPAITFEFLGADGTVIATETVAAESLEPGRAKSFQLNPSGQGIVAWRYRGG
jgi:tetratricopeptide (TPR) repeat protein